MRADLAPDDVGRRRALAVERKNVGLGNTRVYGRERVVAGHRHRDATVDGGRPRAVARLAGLGETEEA